MTATILWSSKRMKMVITRSRVKGGGGEFYPSRQNAFTAHEMVLTGENDFMNFTTERTTYTTNTAKVKRCTVKTMKLSKIWNF